MVVNGGHQARSAAVTCTNTWSSLSKGNPDSVVLAKRMLRASACRGYRLGNRDSLGMWLLRVDEGLPEPSCRLGVEWPTAAPRSPRTWRCNPPFGKASSIRDLPARAGSHSGIRDQEVDSEPRRKFGSGRFFQSPIEDLIQRTRREADRPANSTRPAIEHPAIR